MGIERSEEGIVIPEVSSGVGAVVLVEHRTVSGSDFNELVSVKRHSGTWRRWGVGVRTWTAAPLAATLGLRCAGVRTDDIDEKALSVGKVLVDVMVQSPTGELGPEDPQDSSLPPGIRSRLSERVSHEAIGASLVFGGTRLSNGTKLAAELQSLSITSVGSGFSSDN